MTSVDFVRSFALSLPDSTEQPHFEWSSFRVRGKIFATFSPDGRLLHVFVDEAAVRGLVKVAPDACEELHWGGRLVGVRVRLHNADPDLVRALLEDAWSLRAPASLRRARDAGLSPAS